MTTIQQAIDDIQGIDGELLNTRTRLKELAELFKEQQREDPLPKVFVGIASGYRYSNRADDGKFGKPTHKFEIDCGAGLWLYVSANGEDFDRFMDGAEVGEFASVEKMVNGKVIRVERAEKDLVPTAFLGEPYDFRDARGQVLYYGAQITHVEPKYNGTVIAEDASAITVRVSDGAGVRVSPEYCIRAD